MLYIIDWPSECVQKLFGIFSRPSNSVMATWHCVMKTIRPFDNHSSNGGNCSRGRAGPWIAVFVLPGKIYVFQHGGDWERSLCPKNVHIFLFTLLKITWACDHVAEMLLILRPLFSTWLSPRYIWPTVQRNVTSFWLGAICDQNPANFRQFTCTLPCKS